MKLLRGRMAPRDLPFANYFFQRHDNARMPGAPAIRNAKATKKQRALLASKSPSHLKTLPILALRSLAKKALDLGARLKKRGRQNTFGSSGMSVGMVFPREVHNEVCRALIHIKNSQWYAQNHNARTAERQDLSLLLVLMLGCGVLKGGKLHGDTLRADLEGGGECYRNAPRESNQM